MEELKELSTEELAFDLTGSIEEAKDIHYNGDNVSAEHCFNITLMISEFFKRLDNEHVSINS